MAWTGLKVVCRPSSLYTKVTPHNSCTVEINRVLHTITDHDLYLQLLQCRSDEQRTAAITAWKLTHGSI